jgi:hypothetical protein
VTIGVSRWGCLSKISKRSSFLPSFHRQNSGQILEEGDRSHFRQSIEAGQRGSRKTTSQESGKNLSPCSLTLYFGSDMTSILVHLGTGHAPLNVHLCQPINCSDFPLYSWRTKSPPPPPPPTLSPPTYTHSTLQHG